MAIRLKPETEELVRKEIQSGHFESVDDLITKGVEAWRTEHGDPLAKKDRRRRTRRVGGRVTTDQLQARRAAVERALDFALHRAIRLEGVSIKELIHEGHRL